MSTPTLPGSDPDPQGRASALEERRDNYRFVHDWPAGVATSSWLPKESDYSTEYSLQLGKTYGSIGVNYAKIAGREAHRGPLHALKEIGAVVEELDPKSVSKEIFSRHSEKGNPFEGRVKPTDWHDYAQIFAHWETPDIAAKVNDSATLGDAIAWQRIAGVNPTVLARCTEIPAEFPVTDHHVKLALPSDSLQAALSEGRAFLADYRSVEGIACGVTDGNQKYLAGPIALYIADRSGTLRSVAIQCGSDPSRYPVRTPADGWHWRMANLCVQVTDANHHEGSAHLGRTHMVMEACGVAMKRELAPNHPLAVLLEPHLDTTFAINHSAKTSLIARGGTVDQVFAPQIRAFGDFVQSQVSTYSIADANPSTDLAHRGLDDRDVLPVHPYRDDMLPVHGAIRNHVERYIRVYYQSDAAVQGDTELTGFVAALSAEGGGRLHDVPEVATVDQLIDLVTSFVWIGSAQHSAVNFPQFRFMGYMPNMAGALFAPVPDASTENSESAFLDLLPPWKVTNNGVTMVFLLSDLYASKLGKYALKAFSDPRVAPLVASFQAELAAVERDTKARDAKRWLPYTYLYPSQILQSISI